MTSHYFIEKPSNYYTMGKPQILSLIPSGEHRILDLGCAAGILGMHLKNSQKASELIGIEINEEAAKIARKYYDQIFLENLEEVELPFRDYFDFVICGDILEHLSNPWSVLRKIRLWIKKEGYIISSIPNIRYWEILRNLVFRGRWEYMDSGVLDITHLRFFTRRDFIRFMVDGGFEVTHQEMTIHGKKKKAFNQLTGSVFSEFLGSQFIVVAKCVK